MYEIIFGLADGQIDLFDDITEIRIGTDVFHLKTVNENEVLTYAFNTKSVYQLIGKNKNIIYYRPNVNYVSISQKK